MSFSLTDSQKGEEDGKWDLKSQGSKRKRAKWQSLAGVLGDRILPKTEAGYIYKKEKLILVFFFLE